MLALGFAVAACGSPTAPGASGTASGSPASASASAATITPAGTASASASTPSPVPVTTRSATPTIGPPAPGQTIVVTQADSGSTVRMRTGDSLEVRLDSNYDPPAAQGDDVLRRTSSTGGYPTGRPVDAVFKANAAGDADVSSTTDYSCLHSTPRCGLPQRLWSVHVIVSSS